MRKILNDSQIDKNALTAIESFHSNIVAEVEKAVLENEIVVVGMRQNPVCKKARRVLDEAGLKYHYLEYGSYFSMWKPRLAIKIWSGWPTFPQVFHRGKLIGGASDLVKYLSEGKLKSL